MAKNQTTKQAFLYSRVSSEKQLSGQGLERQEQAAIEFLSRYPEYTLSDLSFTDSGVSAFSGANIQENAGLGSFLAACRTGEIPPDSLLVVEAPDRLSRLGIREGQKLVNEIFSYGIDIALVRFGLILYADDGNNLSDLIATIGFYLGALESDQKSERIKKAIDAKRKTAITGGEKRTQVAPAWLELSEDRKTFKPIPERVELLKRMFEMKYHDGMGPDKIARVFNEEGLLSFTGKPWSRTVIRSYLTEPKVIGHYQPQTVRKEHGKRIYEDLGAVVEDYYPCVIDPDLFHATQQTFKKATAGRKGNFANLFQGLVFCRACSGIMAYNSNISTAGNRNKYLRCKDALRGGRGCSEPSFPYDVLEHNLISILSGLDYSKLVNGTDTDKIEAEIQGLSIKQDSLNTQLEKQIELAAMTEGKRATQIIMGKVGEIETELESIQSQISELRTQAKTVEPIDTNISDLDLSSYDSRLKFNRFLKQYMESLHLKHKDQLTITLKGKGAIMINFYNKDGILCTPEELEGYDLPSLIMQEATRNTFSLELGTTVEVGL